MFLRQFRSQIVLMEFLGYHHTLLMAFHHRCHSTYQPMTTVDAGTRGFYVERANGKIDVGVEGVSQWEVGSLELYIVSGFSLDDGLEAGTVGLRLQVNGSMEMGMPLGSSFVERAIICFDVTDKVGVPKVLK